jgi:hypothetical protein
MKIKNIPFIIFLVIVVIYSIGYPLYKSFFQQRKLWFNAIHKELVQRYPNVPEKNLDLYAKCLYTKFSQSYLTIKNFPERSKYTHRDVEAIYDCTIEYLFLDSIRKQKAIINRDSVINILIKNTMPNTDNKVH